MPRWSGELICTARVCSAARRAHEFKSVVSSVSLHLFALFADLRVASVLGTISIRLAWALHAEPLPVESLYDLIACPQSDFGRDATPGGTLRSASQIMGHKAILSKYVRSCRSPYSGVSSALDRQTEEGGS